MIQCGFIKQNTPDGVEFDCHYDPIFDCQDCIINGGKYSPVTNKIFRGNRKLYKKKSRFVELKTCYRGCDNNWLENGSCLVGHCKNSKCKMKRREIKQRGLGLRTTSGTMGTGTGPEPQTGGPAS